MSRTSSSGVRVLGGGGTRPAAVDEPRALRDGRASIIQHRATYAPRTQLRGPTYASPTHTGSGFRSADFRSCSRDHRSRYDVDRNAPFEQKPEVVFIPPTCGDVHVISTDRPEVVGSYEDRYLLQRQKGALSAAMLHVVRRRLPNANDPLRITHDPLRITEFSTADDDDDFGSGVYRRPRAAPISPARQ